jgi:hypothetical protein
LRVRLTPNGVTTWSLSVRINGTRRVGIGERLGLAPVNDGSGLALNCGP